MLSKELLRTLKQGNRFMKSEIESLLELKIFFDGLNASIIFQIFSYSPLSLKKIFFLEIMFLYRHLNLNTPLGLV